MNRLACRAARRHLSAYADGELPTDQQIAIQAHLSSCRLCADEAQKVGSIGSALRSGTPRSRGDGRDLVSLAMSVVSRFKAEQDQSVWNRLGRAFEDMHLVWAALGATAASLACIVIINGMLVLAARERPDSLAGVLAALSSAGSNANPALLGGGMLAPRADADTVMPAAIVSYGGTGDAAFALAAVVTREGILSNLEWLGSENASGQADRREWLDVLDAASTARFEPARYEGSPVAVNMIWLLARTTVRGKAHAIQSDMNGQAGRTVGRGRRPGIRRGGPSSSFLNTREAIGA